MEASEWDHATLREEEFEQHAVYLVPDVAASPGDTNRAEASLPRNLVLKPSQALNDVRSSAKESFLETSSVRVARIITISLTLLPKTRQNDAERGTRFVGRFDRDRLIAAI